MTKRRAQWSIDAQPDEGGGQGWRGPGLPAFRRDDPEKRLVSSHDVPDGEMGEYVFVIPDLPQDALD